MTNLPGRVHQPNQEDSHDVILGAGVLGREGIGRQGVGSREGCSLEAGGVLCVIHWCAIPSVSTWG